MSQTQLSEGCSISDDCSTITCNMDFVDEPITFKLKVQPAEHAVFFNDSATYLEGNWKTMEGGAGKDEGPINHSLGIFF